MSDDVLIRCENVSKIFCRDLKKSLWYGVQDIAGDLFGRNKKVPKSSDEVTLRDGEFWANKDISFEVKRGECLGLIGRNGAGKTTLLKMLNGLIKPDTGNIEIAGQIGALIALGAGFNPLLTGRENIYINGRILGFTHDELRNKFDEIVDFSELSLFIDSPIKSYSSGMKIRLGFAIASLMRPNVLLIDEVLAVGDVNFRIKCVNKILEVLPTCAVVFVSHHMTQVLRICSSAMVLDRGQIEFMSNDVTLAAEEYVNNAHAIESAINISHSSLVGLNSFAFYDSNGKRQQNLIHSQDYQIRSEVWSDERGTYTFFILFSGFNGNTSLAIRKNNVVLAEGPNSLSFPFKNVFLNSSTYTIRIVVYKGSLENGEVVLRGQLINFIKVLRSPIPFFF